MLEYFRFNPRDYYNSLVLTKDNAYEWFIDFRNSMAPYVIFGYALVGEIYHTIKTLFKK